MKIIGFNNLKKIIQTNILYLIVPLVVTLLFTGIFYYKKKNTFELITVISFNYKYKFTGQISKILKEKLDDIISVDEFSAHIFSTVDQVIKNQKNLNEISAIYNIKDLLFDKKVVYKLKRIPKELESEIFPTRILPSQNFSYFKKYKNSHEVLTIFYNSGYDLYVHNFIFLKEKKLNTIAISKLEEELHKIDEAMIDSLIILINKKHTELNSLNNAINSIMDYVASPKEKIPTYNLEKIKKNKLLKDNLYYDLTQKKFLNQKLVKIYNGKEISKFYKILIGAFLISIIIFFFRILLIFFNIVK